MIKFSSLTNFFSSKRGFLVSLALIFLIATVSRFYQISQPPGYFFDEVYHALTSKLIARNDPRAYEWWNEPVEPNTAVDWLHPPLAKYTQALGMKIFGENSLGWRVSSAVFGLLTIAATAACAHVYFNKRSITLLAALIVSFDGLLLAQSRIAMNDIHVTFFIISTLAAYGWFRNRIKNKQPSGTALLLTGVLAGLAMGTKWSGVYVLAAVVTAELVRIIKLHAKFSERLVKTGLMGIFLGAVPILMYLASYSHMFLQGKTLVCTGNQVKQGECYCSQESSFWVTGLSKLSPVNKKYFESLEARGGCKRLISHFSELHNQILWYQTHLNATHPYQSRPWQWVLDLRPVWQHVDYSSSKQGLVANIYNTGNPILYWVGLAVVISLSLMLFLHGLRVGHEKDRQVFSKYSFELGLLLFTYFIVWGPWNFSPRIMFFYHYAPAVPIMSMLIAYLFVTAWHKLKAARIIIVVLVALIGTTYFLLYPLNTGLPMSQGYFDAIFALFPSWK